MKKYVLEYYNSWDRMKFVQSEIVSLNKYILFIENYTGKEKFPAWTKFTSMKEMNSKSQEK
jgi:hypothetical protein